MIKESKSDTESINSSSTSRTVTDGHPILSSTASSLSSSSSGHSPVTHSLSASSSASSGTITSTSGMGFLDELKKLAQNRINPEGLLTDTLNKTNFLREKSNAGNLIKKTFQPDDEKRKRHGMHIFLLIIFFTNYLNNYYLNDFITNYLINSITNRFPIILIRAANGRVQISS